MTKRRHPFWQQTRGACVVDGGVRFEVWAPRARTVAVRLAGGDAALKRDGEVFTGMVRGAAAGMDYSYVLDGERARPDPVSRWQPAGVHGPSRIVDPSSYPWTDADWRGVRQQDAVYYELHVGTFTSAGTFDAVIERLPSLRALGVTVLELMPLAEFPGGRNWGYDGVNLFAPQSTYGGPFALARLIDAAHAAGLGVAIDVVYNHVGPEGNYLGEYGPYFTDRYRTPWGEALNFDGPDSDEVRRLFIDNALHWVSEFHVDALRLDAVHGIFDMSARHIVKEIAERVHTEAQALGRNCIVVAESDLNDTRVVDPPSSGGWGADAQWSDDFHHAVFAFMTGARRGYFEDFGSLADVQKAIVHGYVYDGQHSVHRRRVHGTPSTACAGEQLVGFLENHDQVANGARGDRLSRLVTPAEQKVAAALLLCAPHVPLLFMGQEYGETAPFDYFTSHGDASLAAAVTEGRQREHATLDRPFPDPQDEATYLRSKLNWLLVERPEHRAILDWYRDLLALRRDHPALGACRKDLTAVEVDPEAAWLRIERRAYGHPKVECLVRLARHDGAVPLADSPRPRKLLLSSEDGRALGDRSHLPQQVRAGAHVLTLPGSSVAIFIEEHA